MEKPCGKIDVSDRQPQGFPQPQARQVQQHQGRALHYSTQRRTVCPWETRACRQKAFPLFAGQNPLDVGTAMDSQVSWWGNFMSRIFNGKEAAEFTDEAQPVSARRVGSRAPMSDVGANHLQREDRISGHKVRDEESVQMPKQFLLRPVSASGSPLVIEETLDLLGQRRGEERSIHRSRSSRDMATLLRWDKSTLV